MRVLCVNKNGNWFFADKKFETVSYFFGFKKVTREVPNPAFGPVYGEECNVLRNYVYGKEMFYVLKGYGEWGYIASQFIPMSENEETEVNEKEKVEVK